MQVRVDADSQVVGNPLADARRVVVVDVGRDRAEDCDRERRDAGEKRHAERVAADSVLVRPGEPRRELVLAERIVENELERPRRGEAHRDLDEHRHEYDEEPPMVRPKELQHEARHRPVEVRLCVGVIPGSRGRCRRLGCGVIGHEFERGALRRIAILARPPRRVKPQESRRQRFRVTARCTRSSPS